MRPLADQEFELDLVLDRNPGMADPRDLRLQPAGRCDGAAVNGAPAPADCPAERERRSIVVRGDQPQAPACLRLRDALCGLEQASPDALWWPAGDQHDDL